MVGNKAITAITGSQNGLPHHHQPMPLLQHLHNKGNAASNNNNRSPPNREQLYLSTSPWAPQVTAPRNLQHRVANGQALQWAKMPGLQCNRPGAVAPM